MVELNKMVLLSKMVVLRRLGNQRKVELVKLGEGKDQSKCLLLVDK